MFSTVTAAPVVRVADGQTYEFPKLKRRELGRLLAKWSAEDRARLIALFDQAAIPPDVKATRLAEHDADSRLLSYVLRRCVEYERCDEVLLASLRCAKPDTTAESVEALPFGLNELAEVALEVCGFRAPREQEGDSSGPKGGDASQPIGTSTGS